ncbi:MAG: hypothetical protein ABIA63_10440 [bacterium]
MFETKLKEYKAKLAKQARQEGIEKEKINITVKAERMGLSIKEISRLTDLSEYKVRAIIKNAGTKR